MDIVAEIEKLKTEKNAVILAHYYANEETQAIADYVGDSYYLAVKAQETEADIIVFCGVAFMGESAKILNPGKTVIMPDAAADCAMAHMADVDRIDRLRREYDDLAVVCYINSTAELKCHSDVCVTSANAVKIVNSLPNKNILFIPDKNLGAFVAKSVKGKNIILNDGYCPIHANMQRSELENLIAAHPDAEVLAHPECREDILSLANYIGSTSGIITYAEKSRAKAFIICTERGVAYELKRRMPDKRFYFAEGCCKDMKLNTLQKLYDALRDEKNQIEVDNKTREKALRPLRRMLELAR